MHFFGTLRTRVEVSVAGENAVMDEIRDRRGSQTMDITHEYSARSPSEVLWSNRKLKCTGTDFSTLLQGPKFDMKQRLATPEQQ